MEQGSLGGSVATAVYTHVAVVMVRGSYSVHTMRQCEQVSTQVSKWGTGACKGVRCGRMLFAV